MAGDAWNLKSDGGSVAPHQAAQLLADVAHKHSSLPFHIIAAVGTQDGTSGSMAPQIHAMKHLTAFSDANLSYYHVPGGTHSPGTVARAFRHFAKDIIANR